ncbi:hypothetical protein A2125_01255 [Candidatus Woesebacteria bacterium GWB1_43_5]|uniref:Uncharacterized protein n=1 Tax=Candidatus Woesebacteria bacterium GWB1_43_5 TaxID=1802474 RepID=A0A1F7WRL9_9BACT|nr:MAG: hypothetical protein A2125_01255 [Candidatus Woesebacteria bacterium GWB1_43_5]
MEFTDPSGQTPAQLKDIEVVFSNIVGAAIALAGIVLFIMLVIGGFKYLTAGGEPPKIESARKTLTYAILGIVFIALSFLFLRFIGVFTGVQDITIFKIFQGN